MSCRALARRSFAALLFATLASVSRVATRASSMALWSTAAALGLALQASAAILTVTGTGDTIAADGVCTLREAITQVNAGGPAANGCTNSGAAFGTTDEIRFNIPGAGVHTVAPASALPTITVPVFIDGYSQPGSSANSLASGWDAVILVELDGSGAGAGIPGLVFVASGARVSGLAVYGFDETGIRLGWIVPGNADNNTVDGNILGLRADGSTLAGNTNYGVAISALGSATGNTIGGAAASARNIISGNGSGGLVINSHHSNTVRGNHIGSNAAGNAPRSNQVHGVFINQGVTNTVSHNLISGNSNAGVYIAGDSSSGNVITNNVIGTTWNLAGALPNGTYGVHVIRGVNTMIGGTAGQGNVIAYNGDIGVLIGNLHPNYGNSILGNSIHSNGQLGIILGAGTFAPNDPGDVDVGYNNYQNFPVLTGALPSGAISGNLNSLANTTFRVEFFSSPRCHPEAHGDGQHFLGASNFTTDGAGNVAVSLSAGALTPGEVVSATATNQSTGDTSEFSACIVVAAAPAPEIQVIADLIVIASGDTTPWTRDRTDFGTRTMGATLTYSYDIANIGSANLNLGANAVSLSGAGCGEFSVTVQPANLVAVGGQTTFSVQYLAGTSGTFTCTVSINNDDTDESPFGFLIRGAVSAVSAPEIELAGNSVSIASGDVTPLLADWTDFGITAIGTPISHSFVISNRGSAVLTLGLNPVSLSGAGCAEFSIFKQPDSLAPPPHQWATFYLAYLPTDAGTDTCTVSINNDDADESPYTFVIRGAASIPGEIEISGNAVPITDGDVTPSLADHTDFGSTTEGLPLSRTFTISNTGSGVLTLGANAVTLIGGGCWEFAVTSQPATTVAASGSTTFTMQYLALGVGTGTCTVNVNSDDADENPYEFAIQGTTTPSPEITIYGNSNAIADGDTTPSLTDHTDFGTTAVGTPVTRNFTISNSGTAVLNLGANAVTLTGPGCGEFSVTSQPPTSLATSVSSSFVVQYLPTNTGTDSCTVNVNSDDLDENPYNFAIQGGTGAPPVQGAAAIPTLSPWGLGLLSGVMGLAFFFRQRRRLQ